MWRSKDAIYSFHWNKLKVQFRRLIMMTQSSGLIDFLQFYVEYLKKNSMIMIFFLFSVYNTNDLERLLEDFHCWSTTIEHVLDLTQNLKEQIQIFLFRIAQKKKKHDKYLIKTDQISMGMVRLWREQKIKRRINSSLCWLFS